MSMSVNERAESRVSNIEVCPASYESRMRAARRSRRSRSCACFRVCSSRSRPSSRSSDATSATSRSYSPCTVLTDRLIVPTFTRTAARSALTDRSAAVAWPMSCLSVDCSRSSLATCDFWAAIRSSRASCRARASLSSSARTVVTFPGWTEPATTAAAATTPSNKPPTRRRALGVVACCPIGWCMARVSLGVGEKARGRSLARHGRR